MSGHSKWHNIQVRKGKQDKMKANVFTKLARAITVSARSGGGDPTMNVALRIAIEQARMVNMPMDNIERAVARGTGADSDGIQMAYALYEGYGPGGAALLIEANTDNKTRTVADIKAIFNKRDLSLGAQGSVQWMFERFAVFRFSKEQNTSLESKKSDIELAFIDAGAVDIIESEFGIEVRGPITCFQKISDTAVQLGLTADTAQFEWIAKDAIAVSPHVAAQVEDLVVALDELDDVSEVYTALI